MFKLFEKNEVGDAVDVINRKTTTIERSFRLVVCVCVRVCLSVVFVPKNIGQSEVFLCVCCLCKYIVFLFLFVCV